MSIKAEPCIKRCLISNRHVSATCAVQRAGVWCRRNLQTHTQCIQDKEEQARSAYIEAEALVKRCLNNSHQLWNRIMLWTEASAPRQSAYSLARSPSRARSKSLSDAPLGGTHASPPGAEHSRTQC